MALCNSHACSFIKTRAGLSSLSRSTARIPPQAEKGRGDGGCPQLIATADARPVHCVAPAPRILRRSTSLPLKATTPLSLLQTAEIIRKEGRGNIVFEHTRRIDCSTAQFHTQREEGFSRSQLFSLSSCLSNCKQFTPLLK